MRVPSGPPSRVLKPSWQPPSGSASFQATEVFNSSAVYRSLA